MLEKVKKLNKKNYIWIITALLVSILSSKYAVYVVGEMTDAIVGNNAFVFLTILLFHILMLVIMGADFFEIKKSGIIATVSIVILLILRKILLCDTSSIILAIQACAFLIVVGHVCCYLIKKSTRFFLLFLGESALLLMSFIVPVFSDFSLTFFGVLVAVSFWKLQDIYNDPTLKKFVTLKATVLFGILDIYASFALVGHSAFLKNVTFDITVRGIIGYCLCLFIVYPLLMLLSYALIKIRLNSKCQEKSISHYEGFIMQIKCFLLMMVPLFILLLGFYPTIMTTDGLNQWGQAIGVWNINDSHPVISTLFIKLCSKIAKTPYMVSMVQIILFSLLWSSILKFLYQRGKINERLLYAISLCIALSPTNYMMLFLVSKNILYGIVVIWVTFLFIKLYDDEGFLSWKMIFPFGIALALLYTVRHNGIIGTIIACGLLIGIAIRKFVENKKEYCIKTCLIIVAMVSSVMVIKGPIYSYFGVEKKASNTYTYGPLVQAAGIYHLADKEIPSDVKDIVDRIGTKEQWIKYYNPYDGDILGWSELKDTMKATEKEEMFKLYFTLLKNDPLLVIKARLNAVDLLWNVFEPTETYNHYGGHNNSFYCGMTIDPGYEANFPELLKEEYRQENGDYVKANIVTTVSKRLAKISYQNDVFKSIFWRNGIHTVIMLWIFVVNAIEKNKKVFLSGLVPFATLGSLALAASWQIYQYYWFFPISVLLLGLATVAERKEL